MSATYYPEESEATTALVLGLLSLLVPILAPFAWYYGSREVNAIDAKRRDPANRGSADAGRILGLVITVLGALTLLFVIVVGVWALISR